MKAKTIKAALRRKIDDWLSSIEDEDVRKAAKRDTIVTGGCIASMLLKEKVNDYDVYFRTYETTKMVANYYLSRFCPKDKSGVPVKMYVDDSDDRVRIIIKSAGIASENGTKKNYEYFEARPEDEAGKYVSDVMQDVGDIEDAYEETERKALEVENDKPSYRPVFMSTNAITLSDKIQIILRFYGEPDEIHDNYDFVHCTNYWESKSSTLTLRREALESLLSRELLYRGSRYPIASLIRVRKFIRRNWTINAGQILKMAMQVSELNLKDVGVLEDQLTGVDVAYFCELISKVREDDPNKINSAYICEIVDRMF